MHYHFRSMEQFEEMAATGQLLEWAIVFGRGYGTPRAPVEEALAAGQDMVFDIDWQGHQQVRQALPDDVVSLFVLPPSLEELERRLTSRASDHPDEIARRMAAARDEISHWHEFDHVVVNKDLDRAIFEARAILTAGRLKTRRQTGLEEFVGTFGA
ncbi:Guanylate kinase [Acetobacter tropicalis]|uniref:Guanylate kinase n=1 Tax=Acetobacter tropicalis TaxID=104102 RepID=A0A094ZTV5_9PROT|nr:Guanylate kinase [Acetobacter tropicalis]